MNNGTCARLPPLRLNHVWSDDYVHERSHDERTLRMLTLRDEFTSKSLAIEVRHRFCGSGVIEIPPDALGTVRR